MKELAQIKPVSWIKFTIYGLLFFGIYYSAFTKLITKDWEREAYSYCWLIPPVVFYLIWLKRDELASTSSEPSWAGLLPIGFGIVFFWLGELGGEYFTMYVSFWLILVGICWLHLGWHKLKTIGFALFFMLTMFPVPQFINTRIMLQLRLISSELGVGIIKMAGLPVYLEGNIIDLGFTQLQVVEACSGLHSLISLVVLCLLLVYFIRDHLWKRAVLLISSIPLAIITNSMRIALTAILFKNFGEEVAQGFFHGFSGLLIFAFCIPVLFMEMKILEKLPPKISRAPSASADDFDKKPEAVIDRVKDNDGGIKGSVLFRQPIFIIAVILLGTTLSLSSTVEFREKIPLKISLNQFPLKVGEWSADRRLPIAQIFLDALDLSEYVMVDYKDRSGKSVNFYIAYYESQSKGKSIHSPASCLPGSGWDFKQSGTVPIPDVLSENGAMLVNRAVMQLGRQYQLSYYWFPQRGRILTNAYQLKFYVFWDSLTNQRTDGALVRLVTQVYDGEKLEEAEARLKEFVRDIVPVLDEYIPGREI
ncbi:VPLPA-CTERM-specific exosortase XrtD [Thermodesulfobacteriota bacterium]